MYVTKNAWETEISTKTVIVECIFKIWQLGLPIFSTKPKWITKQV